LALRLGVGLGLLGRDVDLGRLFEAILERLDALPEAANDLGQPTRTEHHEHDHQYDEELTDPQSKHSSPIIGERPMQGKSANAVCASGGRSLYSAAPDAAHVPRGVRAAAATRRKARPLSRQRAGCRMQGPPPAALRARVSGGLR